MKKFFALSLFSALLLPSCKKAQEAVSGEQFYCTRIAECVYDTLGQQPMIGWNWDMQGNWHYKAPCFNPSNASQFVYLRKGFEDGIAVSLQTFDMSTKETTVLVEGLHIINQPLWSKKDWILFTTLSHQLYKVKANGDSLTQLTQTGSDQVPSWDPDGERIVRKHNDGWGNSCIILSDENLQAIDTLTTIWENCWFTNDKIITASGGYVGMLDIHTNQKNTLLQWPNEEGQIVGIAIDRNSHNFYYSLYQKGLYVYNLNSKEVIQLKDSCEACWYNALSCSSQQSILAERETWTQVNSWTLDVTTEIWLMDANGCNERRILPVE